MSGNKAAKLWLVKTAGLYHFYGVECYLPEYVNGNKTRTLINYLPKKRISIV